MMYGSGRELWGGALDSSMDPYRGGEMDPGLGVHNSGAPNPLLLSSLPYMSMDAMRGGMPCGVQPLGMLGGSDPAMMGHMSSSPSGMAGLDLDRGAMYNMPPSPHTPQGRGGPFGAPGGMQGNVPDLVPSGLPWSFSVGPNSPMGGAGPGVMALGPPKSEQMYAMGTAPGGGGSMQMPLGRFAGQRHPDNEGVSPGMLEQQMPPQLPPWATPDVYSMPPQPKACLNGVMPENHPAAVGVHVGGPRQYRE